MKIVLSPGSVYSLEIKRLSPAKLEVVQGGNKILIHGDDISGLIEVLKAAQEIRAGDPVLRTSPLQSLELKETYDLL